MKAIVLVPFFTQDLVGVVGSEIDIKDQKTFDDLVKAGYIKAIETAPKRGTKRDSDSE
jgi:hypothetical protein